MLDLESEVMRGPGSIFTGGNILSLDFFDVVKASDANIDIIANFANLRKTRLNPNLQMDQLEKSFIMNYMEKLVKAELLGIMRLYNWP